MVKSTFPRRKLNGKICNIHFSILWFFMNRLAQKLLKLIEIPISYNKKFEGWSLVGILSGYSIQNSLSSRNFNNQFSTNFGNFGGNQFLRNQGIEKCILHILLLSFSRGNVDLIWSFCNWFDHFAILIWPFCFF